MNKILDIIINSEIMQKITRAIHAKNFPINITGVIESQKCHLFSAIKEKLNCQMIFISYSELQAKRNYDDLKVFRDDVYYYPSKDFVSYLADVKSSDVYKQRFDVLNSLMEQKKCSIVLSIEALFDRLSPPDYFKQSILKLNIGMNFLLDDLSRHLIFLGYERAEIVEAPGQFSVRGGIFDICTSNYAVRLEFFDNEIDSIRLFDTISQRSLSSVDKIEITPMRELIYSDEKFAAALDKIKAESNDVEKITLLEQNVFNTDMYANFFCDGDVCLLDYLAQNCLIFLDEPSKVLDNAKNFYDDCQTQIQKQIEIGYMLPSQKNIILSYEQVFEKLQDKSCVTFENFPQTSEFTAKNFIECKTKTPETFKIYSDFFLDSLKKYLAAKKIVIILAGAKFNNLARYLVNKNIPVEFLDNANEILPNRIYITSGALHANFEYENLVIISCGRREKSHGSKNKNLIQNFLDLKLNDLIVHEKHGIAVYKGIEKITVDGVTKDYLKLEYADGGVLFVNTAQMDLVQKYIGAENVRLNKLGGSDWQKNKLRVREEVQKIAADLINLYAKRKNTKGFKFSSDNVWQNEFESSFPYEETADQLSAINDIKKDMQSDIVMDRLICGDVGYGKTEVAMRAAFKAVQDSKQVAYLVPTTILAQQHFNTFLNRFADFPINIEMLSRFRTLTQQKKIIAQIKSGRLDIIIGTHKLLSNEISFKNLGLVIIDEEQRFGVAHKEKLKKLCENIDVLTLTATPIPRTLNMSLSGIRDMSLLTEPPLERQPVQTYVIEHNMPLIKEAIENELKRNGQVYYLFNQVKNIAAIAYQIKKLVPTATVRYAHGQLSETELEKIMEEFIRGQIDILVCTTIIETGMDIPNVNTIIIQNADKMGLAQLYQLRGRVGRSNKLAYAYLTYEKNKNLNENAIKRLQTIREFTEFGAGFKIAMKDLEIRGAGNLLGAQQHGNIETVGYDLYCKLLNEEIKKLNGAEIQNEIETNIDINISAYIPQNYISDEKQKLDMYKKISFVSNQQDYLQMQEELIDRYGDVPNAVQNLIDIALLKSLAQKLRITSISQKFDNLIMMIDKDAEFPIEKLLTLIKDEKQLFFTTNPAPYITYKNFDARKHIKKLWQILLKLI